MPLNWTQITSDFGIPIDNRKSQVHNHWIGCVCPFCGKPGGSPNMGLNTRSGATNCWSCGAHTPMETLTALLRLPKGEVFTIYKKYNTRSTGQIFKKKKSIGTAEQVIIPTSKSFTDKELTYMKKRMITDKHKELYDLRSGGYYGDFGGRIVIPIYYQGDIVSATARTIQKGVEPKYWTLPPDREVIHHKSILFGLDDVKSFPVLVEGPLDSIRGGSGFVSSFGAQVTDEQLLLLTEYERVGILFDKDETGKRQAYQYGEFLSALGVDVELYWLDNMKDLGDTVEEEIDSIRLELGMEAFYQ